MSELIFLIEEAPEGGYIAHALGESIFTEADTIEQLYENVQEAVHCHFDKGEERKTIKLRFTHEKGQQSLERDANGAWNALLRLRG